VAAGRRFLMYAAAATVGIAGATLVYAPASLAAWLVAHSTNGSVTIDQPSGTVWSGSGDLLIRIGRGTLQVPNLSWSVRPASLLIGDLAASVRADGPEVTGTADVDVTPSTIAVHSARIGAPLSAAAAGLPVVQSLGASGQLTLRTDGLSIKGPAVEGAAEVLVEKAQSARYGSLGDYRIALGGAASGATVQVTTLRGPLHISGSGDVSPAGELRFNGEMSADADARERFVPVLSFLGAPRADGSVTLEWPLSGTGALRGAPVVSAN